MNVRDLVIVGSGPAGYTAAIYAARAELHPLVIEGVAAGGALIQTTTVENFPGFVEGVQGPDLMEAMRKQALGFGAEFVTDDASAVDLTGPVKTVSVGPTSYGARAVILATGSKYRSLGLPSEQRLLGHGVSACATCDGFFFRGRPVIVVGGGDSAMEEATFLTRFASSVTVVHRRGELRASRIMQERALANPKINFVYHSVVEDILGTDSVTGIALRDVRTDERVQLDTAGVFLAIGHDPSSALFAGQVDLAASGHALVEHPSTRTNLPGVFACGDLVDHVYQQAITAAGTGAAAALDAQHYLAA